MYSREKWYAWYKEEIRSGRMPMIRDEVGTYIDPFRNDKYVARMPAQRTLVQYAMQQHVQEVDKPVRYLTI